MWSAHRVVHSECHLRKAFKIPLLSQVGDLRDQLKRSKLRASGGLDAQTIELIELKAGTRLKGKLFVCNARWRAPVLLYKLTKRVTPQYVELVHQENQASLKEVNDVKNLLFRTLQDLKSKRKPEIKRRLENKIRNLVCVACACARISLLSCVAQKMERVTLKNEKNAFVTDCNDLASVFEDKNKLEHKLSMTRRKITKILKNPDEEPDIDRFIQSCR
jgi:hypothetical protein